MTDSSLSNGIILYHGSRGGIKGNIKPISRERSDFGQGFYMGTRREQAMTLVAYDDNPHLYEIKINIEAISVSRVLELKDMDWAYFVLFNRGRLEGIKGSSIYEWCKHISDNKDLIIGPIADDAMNEVMSRFMNNDITDKAFLESIRGLDYGMQYVTKTENACSQVRIVKETVLRGQELQRAIDISAERRVEGGRIAKVMQDRYRREGYFLDEILKEELHKVEEEYCL